MKSITLHNLDDETVELIEKKSKESGLSLNKTIKNLLDVALGRIPEEKKMKREEFSNLFGAWNSDDFRDFEKNTEEFNQIDREDWK